MDAWVIVDSEVGESFVGAGQSAASDEVGRKHAVATLAWHIVGSIGGEKQPAAQQLAPTGCLDDGSPDDSPVLVLVGLEEVLLECCPHPQWQSEAEGASHNVRSHSRTFVTLSAAVSVAGFSRLLRLDSCSAFSL